MWLFSSPAAAALGGGYPWAPLGIAAHPCTLLRIPPCTPQELGQNGERNAAWVAVIVLCLRQLLRFPNEMFPLSICGNTSCSQQQGPLVLAVFQARGAASCWPSLLLLGPTVSMENSMGHETRVPALPLCPSCHQATYLQLCRQCWGTPAWAPPSTATTSCLLQIFHPEKVNISFPESRITFLRVGFWTFY